jgi:hypothetical protein
LACARTTIYRVFAVRTGPWAVAAAANGGHYTDCVDMNNSRTRAVISIGLLRQAFRSFCFETPTKKIRLEQSAMDEVIQKMREHFDADIELRHARHQHGDAVTLCRWNGMAAMIAIAAGTKSTVEFSRAQARYRARHELQGRHV